MTSKSEQVTLQYVQNDKAADASHSLVSDTASEYEEATSSHNSLSSAGARKKKFPSLRNKALQYLARRDYARAELHQKLLPFTENPDEIKAILDDFTTRGWLSDTRFAEQWAHQRGVRYGAQRLKQELRMKGVADATIATTLSDIAGTEEDRARAVWQRKFGSPAADNKEKARQLRFLAARGFSLDVIYKVVASCEVDDY